MLNESKYLLTESGFWGVVVLHHQSRFGSQHLKI